MRTPPEITRLLEAWTGDDRAALDALMPWVVDEMKRIASAYLARESPSHTLQTTALVNEAYLRLARMRPASWTSRAQFFALAAQIMRHVLVDYARSRLAAQRGGAAVRIPIHENLAGTTKPVLALDEALQSLEKLDPRKARIVEMRVFGGFSNSEVAAALTLSERTVNRDWQFAKAWLARELGYEAPDAD